MKKLSADQEGKREAFANDLDKLFDELKEAHGKFEDVVSEYNIAVTAINEKISDIKEFVTEITTDIQQFIDDKSEKWQEGDAGESYGNWRDAWEELETEEVQGIDMPTDPEMMPEYNIAGALRDLPSEPE